MESGAAGPVEPHLAQARPVWVREKPAAPAISSGRSSGQMTYEESVRDCLHPAEEWLELAWELEVSFVELARPAVGRLKAVTSSFAQLGDLWLAQALRSIAQLEASWRSLSDGQLQEGERTTLEIGLVIVVLAATAGLQVGHWPAWSGLVAVAGYLAWTVLYSEATVQSTRWQLGRSRMRSALSTKPVTPPG